METETDEYVNGADDLFGGAGGWDLAAQRLGIHARGVENMKEARATRDAAGLTTIHDDVWTFDPLAHVRAEGETNNEVYARVYRETGSMRIAGIVAGLIASPPCQTFSQAGKGAGRKALNDVLALIPQVKNLTLPGLREAGQAFGDERTALVLTPLWFLMHHGTYRWAAWEQVPTVLPVWEACADALRADGWSVWTGILQAEQYGVPQTRKRAFLLASRDHVVTPPTPTHSRYYSRTPDRLDEGVAKWVSMAEGLGWGACTCGGACVELRNNNTANAAVRGENQPAPTIYFGQRCNYVAWEARPSHFIATNDRPNAAKRTPDQPAPTLAFGHERPRWCYERPATTVVGSFCPDVIAAPGYRTQTSRQNAPDSVRVTVSEAGVLQSFPADFPWQGAKGKQFLQCGNAVPPRLAEAALCAALGRPFVPTDLLPAPAQPALAHA